MLGDSWAEAGVCARPGEHVLDVQVLGAHIACITASTVQVWLNGSRIRLVGSSEHSVHELAQVGGNIKLAWQPDGNALAVLTRRSHVLVYELVASGVPPAPVPAGGTADE
eukprot:5144251-Prymnesium_polylepis.1